MVRQTRAEGRQIKHVCTWPIHIIYIPDGNIKFFQNSIF